MKVCWRYYYH